MRPSFLLYSDRQLGLAGFFRPAQESFEVPVETIFGGASTLNRIGVITQSRFGRWTALLEA